MKVVAFNGSPRVGGNTEIMIKKVFCELEKEGIETELIQVGRENIRGCIACFKCMENQNNKCIIAGDNVNTYFQKMIEADAIILGSPVYCSDMSGQMKCFIDRTSLLAKANSDILARKIGASIVAVRRNGAMHTFNSLNSFFTINQMIVVGSSYWNMGFGLAAGEVEQDGEGMVTMENLGKNMAWLLKTLDESKVAQPKHVVFTEYKSGI